MSVEQRRLLRTLLREAAVELLHTPAFVDRDIDPARFTTANTSQLLQVIARSERLRATLAERHDSDLANAHPLLRDLVAPEPRLAESAAVALAADPNRVDAKPCIVATERAEKAGKEERAARRAARDLAQARAARDRARAQFDYAVGERDAARADLSAMESDLADALAVIQALRAELVVTRGRTAALATDVSHAAKVLIEATSPRQTSSDAADRDPRDSELLPEPATASVDNAHPVVRDALNRALLTDAQFLAVLGEIVHPTPPVPESRQPAEAGLLTRDRGITLTPLGGDTDIGGSCMLVEVGGVRMLVDAGMRPKRPMNDAGPRDIHVARAGRIDAIVITHAHNDHAGYVPALMADHSDIDLLCTPDTAALLPTMWADSVKVFSRDVDNTYGEPRAVPPYTTVQVQEAQRRIREVVCGRTVEIAPGVTVELFPAGHILGAAGVVISAGPDRVTITGDVSDLTQATTPGLVVPDSARDCDLLVIESTNCRDGGSHRNTEVDNFVSTVSEIVGSGGRVLVPAFALGRAQEVALTLRDRLPDVPVLIDGMAKEITRIYERQTADGDRPLKIFGENVREVPVERRAELITSFRRGVIVTTSGMLNGGPAVQWARKILPDHTAGLLVAGYQDAESPGRALLDLTNGSSPAFELDGRRVDVNARVAKFGLSAHADRAGLTSIIDAIAPAEVMLVHGVLGAQREYGAYLRSRGHRVVPTKAWRARRL
ncbi:MBL fold metallo-hydrolase [Actinokineospora sp. 24-640]